jgi:threonine/homoserine/homoserine lactone efflux protein
LPVTELAGFLGLAAVVICTPGQDTALTIRNALVGGRRAGIATALGVALGQAVWTCAAAAGAVALLRASQPAFTALRLIGAAYLVFLGLQALRAAFRRRRAEERLAGGRAVTTPDAALRQGLLSNLANPKMAVFFTSLLPQFGEAFVTLLSLGLVFALLTFLWLAAYGIVVARARRLLGRDRVRRAFEAVTGIVLVALGLRLAHDHR